MDLQMILDSMANAAVPVVGFTFLVIAAVACDMWAARVADTPRRQRRSA